MPRQSVNALLAVPISRPRLAPPSDLTDDAKAVWADIVSSLKVDHFQPSDAPLLRAYCEAIVLSQQANAELAKNGPVLGNKTSPWLALSGKAGQAITSLSARLRLCPQSRISKDKASGTHHNPGVPLHLRNPPWEPAETLTVSEFEDEEGDDA